MSGPALSRVKSWPGRPVSTPRVLEEPFSMLAPPDLIVYLCLVNRSSSGLSVPLGNTAITAPAPRTSLPKPHTLVMWPEAAPPASGGPACLSTGRRSAGQMIDTRQSTNINWMDGWKI